MRSLANIETLYNDLSFRNNIKEAPKQRLQKDKILHREKQKG